MTTRPEQAPGYLPEFCGLRAAGPRRAVSKRMRSKLRGMYPLPTINMELRQIVAALTRLPARIVACRAEKFDLMLLLAAHQQVGIDITTIHQMTRRQQFLVG